MRIKYRDYAYEFLLDFFQNTIKKLDINQHAVSSIITIYFLLPSKIYTSFGDQDILTKENVQIMKEDDNFNLLLMSFMELSRQNKKFP